MHGLGEAKTWALDLIADLDAYGRGELAWNAVPRGAVLWSRPGCGKTAVARALAREAGCAFIATSYAQWQAHREGHLGHVTQAIRNIFVEAKQKAPAIVFIDEIDTLGTRGSSKREEDWWRAIINTLLEELDGYARREGVVVIGACNDPDRLDPALARAGRLDRKIEIPLPDVPALAGIFRTYLGDELAGDDLIDLALVAHGGTGADVERWIRDARARARRADRDLTKADLFTAVRGDRKELPDPVRRRIAYHEAGHAIAILATGIATPRSLSISDKGGLSLNEPGERRALTRAHLENYLMILLAGRAAEVLVFGEGTAGAGGSEDSDLGGATRLATRLETAYGLGSSGLLFLPVDPERQFLLPPEVRSSVASTLERMHKAAFDLLVRNRMLLDRLAEALFERGYLETEAILEVVGRHPVQPAQAGKPPEGQRDGPPPLLDLEPADSGDVAPLAMRP
jgi:ATP-dependent Zn protease